MFDRWTTKPPWRDQALLIVVLFVVDVVIVLLILGPQSVLSPGPPAPLAAGPSVPVTPASTDPPPAMSAPAVSIRPTANAPRSEEPAGVLLGDDFDGAVMGRLAAPEWISSPDIELLTVAAFPTSVDRSARLAAPPDDRPATACRGLPDLPERYTVQADIRLSGDAAPGMLMSIESSDAHAQIDRTRTSVILLDGAGSVASDFPIELDSWYRLSIQVDVSSASYAVGIEDLTLPGSAFRDEGLALGIPRGAGDRLCFSVSSSSTAGMNIDDVTVATP